MPKTSSSGCAKILDRRLIDYYLTGNLLSLVVATFKPSLTIDIYLQREYRALGLTPRIPADESLHSDPH
jgi:hypothetical protein